MLIRALIKTLMLPPAANLLLLLVAWLSWRRYPRLAKLSALLSLVSLYLLSIPWVSVGLMNSLDSRYPAITLAADSLPDAIVVLGGGRNPMAEEYGGDTVSTPTLVRLRYGAYLHRQTAVPLLVSGGRVHGEQESEAALMARALTDDFQVAVQWRDEKSRNTDENAKFSAELLLSENRKRIWLVTQAWHMPRSVAAFERHGFEVAAAPTAFSRRPSPDSFWLNSMPRAQSLAESSQALHEWLGIGYYRVTRLLGLASL